jgi:hypothetical protein
MYKGSMVAVELAQHVEEVEFGDVEPPILKAVWGHLDTLQSRGGQEPLFRATTYDPESDSRLIAILVAPENTIHGKEQINSLMSQLSQLKEPDVIKHAQEHKRRRNHTFKIGTMVYQGDKAQRDNATVIVHFCRSQKEALEIGSYLSANYNSTDNVTLYNPTIMAKMHSVSVNRPHR